MSDLLRRRIAHRLTGLFDAHRVVVWHDDSGVLGPLLRELRPIGVEMPDFDGNPLSLRQVMDLEDPWLERRWLLYVPALPDGIACEWLTDYEQAFIQLPQANIAWALRELFGVQETADLRRVLRGGAATTLVLKFGQYFPQERERLTEQEVLRALLRATLQAPAADDMELVLRYLTSPADVEKWRGADLLPSLTAMIKEQLGLRRHLIDGQPPDRGALARCLVASALLEADAVEAKILANHLPQESFRPVWSATLARGLQDPSRRVALETAIREALSASDLIASLAEPLRLARAPALAQIEPKLLDLLLAKRPEAAIDLSSWWDEVISVAELRLGQDGLDRASSILWRSLLSAADLLRRSRRRLDELVTYPAASLGRLAEEYVRRAGGDWELDRLYRLLPQTEGTVPVGWHKVLIEPARLAYHRVVRELTSRFVTAVDVGGAYTATTFMRQTRFWQEMVDTSERVVVLLVDALRADLAHDLEAMLEAGGRKVETRFALAELPTRTEIGMAALLPRADDDFTVRVENGSLVPHVAGVRLPGTGERTRYLMSTTAAQGRKVCREEVGDFLKDDGKLLAECLAAKALPVAHTTDLDDGGDIAANVTFEVFTLILGRCTDFIDRALDLGFSEVVVASDHGFLVRDPEAAQGGVPGTTSAKGGFARGLRFAAGTGDIGRDLVSLPASMLGRAGDDVHVPRDTACVALPGGPGLFVHGGLSPHECALVFLRVWRATTQLVLEPVPVTIHAPERVMTLVFPVTLITPRIATPLLASARQVYVIVHTARGEAVWQTREAMTLPPSDREETYPLTVTVPAAGDYHVSIQDAASPTPIMTVSVHVDVMGAGLEF